MRSRPPAPHIFVGSRKGTGLARNFIEVDSLEVQNESQGQDGRVMAATVGQIMAVKTQLEANVMATTLRACSHLENARGIERPRNTSKEHGNGRLAR